MSIGNDNKVYDEHGYDADGFDARGWDVEGLNRDTGTLYDSNGFNESGFDAEGYDRNGYDPEGYDCEGYNDDGYDAEGYDSDGWHEQGHHRATGTLFDESGYTQDGNEYDDDGYNCSGYDEDGYDCNGEDNEGNTREDNERSEQGEEFDNQLVDYSGDVLEICEWDMRLGQAKELLAGHEIEMYSDDVDIDDVGLVGSQLWKAYRNHNPQAVDCSIGKHDGSLDDNGPGGFETVTVPLTREQTYGVFESFEVLGNRRCHAWNKGPEVGHHIHVSRSAISGLTLGKLAVFMNLPENRKFLTAIAQRPPVYNDFEDGKKLSKPKNRMRHSVLNLTGHTVEFRLFKANLKTQCILKNYEFCIAAIKFCRSTSHQDLNRLDFLKFVAANRKEFGYLHTFLFNHETWRGPYRAFLPDNVAFPKEQGKKPAVDVSTGV
jgi:hypothetical protein